MPNARVGSGRRADPGLFLFIEHFERTADFDNILSLEKRAPVGQLHSRADPPAAAAARRYRPLGAAARTGVPAGRSRCLSHDSEYLMESQISSKQASKQASTFKIVVQQSRLSKCFCAFSFGRYSEFWKRGPQRLHAAFLAPNTAQLGAAAKRGRASSTTGGRRRPRPTWSGGGCLLFLCSVKVQVETCVVAYSKRGSEVSVASGHRRRFFMNMKLSGVKTTRIGY